MLYTCMRESICLKDREVLASQALGKENKELLYLYSAPWGVKVKERLP